MLDDNVPLTIFSQWLNDLSMILKHRMNDFSGNEEIEEKEDIPTFDSIRKSGWKIKQRIDRLYSYENIVIPAEKHKLTEIHTIIVKNGFAALFQLRQIFGFDFMEMQHKHNIQKEENQRSFYFYFVLVVPQKKHKKTKTKKKNVIYDCIDTELFVTDKSIDASTTDKHSDKGSMVVEQDDESSDMAGYVRKPKKDWFQYVCESWDLAQVLCVCVCCVCVLCLFTFYDILFVFVFFLSLTDYRGHQHQT